MNKLKSARILVIGGAGFIGSFIVKELLKEPIKEVIIYDNFSVGKIENIKDYLKDPRCFIYPYGGDIREIDVLDKAMEGIDYVFHLAAMWLLYCEKFIRTAFQVNIEGTFNVLEMCVKHKVKKLIYSSSASAYGDAIEIPMTEDHPLNSKNFYGATKVAGEAMCRAFNIKYSLHIIGLRYMNVYGPKQNPYGFYSGVIPSMLDKIEKGESPIINGDGTQMYNFTYVKDVAKANIAALKSDKKFGYYNINSKEPITIKELCNTILKLKKSNLKPIYKPYNSDDSRALVKNRIGCTKKAKKELGFECKYSLEEGLKELIKWRKEKG